MVADGLIVDDVVATVTAGDVIERYADDRPFPSQLSVARVGGRFVHVVWAMNATTNKVIVITAYEPDPTRWHADRQRRRP